MKILANDGISNTGIEALEAAGFSVETTNVAQEQLSAYINDNDITVYWFVRQLPPVKILLTRVPI